MLAAEGAIEFLYQGRDLFRDGAEQAVAFFGFKIDDGPEMYLPAACVGIVNRMQIVLFQDNVELRDKIGKVFHGNGGVFDHGYRFFIAGEVAEEAEACFAEGPDLLVSSPNRRGKW